MKKVLIAICCLCITVAANAQENKNAPQANPANMPPHPAAQNAPQQPAAAPAAQVDPKAGKFKFEEETHDFGEVPEGPLAETDFEFKNVGKSPIVITEAHGSCGCTVPTWPHDPVLPKHKAVIHVTYNTTGRVGMINKDVYITSNAQQSPMRLHITGTVKAKPVEAKPIAPPPPPKPKN